MRKGVSPLAAAVLMVVATLILAGIVSYWANIKIQSGSHTEPENIVCSKAQFRFYSGSYNGGEKTLSFVLENLRDTSIEIDSLYLVYPDVEVKTLPIHVVLGGNELKSFTVPEIEDGFESGKIKSVCPEISVEFLYSDVT